MNIPNTLTVIRILLIPVFILVFYLPYQWTHAAAAGLFALGAVTDWLDGYLARKLDQISRFGAFLDPVADKLLVAVALVLLVQSDPRAWLAITAAIIIGREIAVSALREFMAEMGQRSQVKVASVGKIKTMAQMLAIILMTYRVPVGEVPVYAIGYVLLVIAAGLTLWSMFVYLRAAWPSLKPGAGE
jgi:CDP-diacylglycerol--glycerol-3-phosphate 3-phosphatidyltransferase